MFADDLVLIPTSKEELKEMRMEINIKSKTLGLEINYKKSAFISNRSQSDIELENNKSYIEYKSETIYLGQIISFDDRTGKEIARRVNLGWNKFWALKFILKNKTST